ncbi:MAG: PQQ-binding-like beta-propeller repeat protein [Blastocatellia bacterium]|nr:PQQ-binding-like beta-propeller repeat protein [Blastocatellia bacterium]
MSSKLSKFIPTLLFLATLTVGGFSQKGNGVGEPFVKCSVYRLDLQDSEVISNDGEFFYVAEPRGVLRAINSRDGRTHWTAELGGSISSTAASDSGRVFVVSTSTDDSAFLRALSRETGITEFVVDLNSSQSPTLAISGETVLISDSNQVAAFSSKDGAQLWSRSHALPGKGRVIVGSRMALAEGNKLLLLNLEDGRVGSEYSFEFPISSVAFANGQTFVGDSRGTIERVSGSSWRYKTGGKIVELAATEFGLFAASHDNFLYMLNADNGKVIWRRRMSGRIAEGRYLTESSVLIPVVGESRLFVVDLKDGKLLNQIELEEVVLSRAPIVRRDGSVIVPANNGLAVYSSRPCENKNGGELSSPP